MTDHDMDNLMCNILSDAIKRDYESDTEKDTPFEPSNRHQNQIRSMLKNPLNWAKKKSWPLWEHILRRVAVAVLVITIGFGSVMAVSPTVRAAVIQWVVEWYETHIMYRYFGEDLTGEMSHYEITGLENNYTETDRIETDISGSVVYENGNGGIVCFDYNYLQQGGFSVFEPSDSDVKEVKVKRTDALLFVPHNQDSMLTITWVDERENVQFCIFANLDENEIVDIAESIRVKTEN